jgi:tetratricopeptide (TPR) repeat protein
MYGLVAGGEAVAQGPARGITVAGQDNDSESLVANGVRAQLVDGDLHAARQWFEAAYRQAERADDTTTMAHAVLGLAGLWVHEHRTVVAATLMQTRLKHVLSLVDPASSLALRLRVRLAGEADYVAGEHGGTLALLEDARRGDDPVARAEALTIAHHCILGPSDGPLRRALADELVNESARTHRRSDLLLGLLWQVVDLFSEADPHAERRLGELETLLAEQNHQAIGYVVAAIRVMLAIRAGRFEEAEALARACAERGAATGDADATGWYGAHLVAIRWFQGRIGELVPMLQEMVHSPTLSEVDNSYFAALAVASATAGDRRAAAGALATLFNPDRDDLPRSSSWLVTMYGIVETANLLDDSASAKCAYLNLSPLAHLPIMASLGVACFGSVQHALGVAALTFGDTQLAVEHFQEAIQRNLALGHWPAVVSSRLRLAEALTLRGEATDESAAAHQRQLAAEEASPMGLTLAGTASKPDAPEHPAVVARQGRKWRIEVAGRVAVIDHCVGMLHLAVLLANPGAEIAAVELAAGVNTLGGAVESRALSAQPMLDRVAIAEYRQRIARLRQEIEELESRNNRQRAAQARSERDWLMAELASATGIGGRARHFPDTKERARLAVGKAIRRAIARIQLADALVGEHLRGGVHTGLHCWYRPA